MKQLKIKSIYILMILLVSKSCYSQNIKGYVYSNLLGDKYIFTFEKRNDDTLTIYSLMTFALDRKDTLKMDDFFYFNDIYCGRITKDLVDFIDKDNIKDKLWLFYPPFQIDSTKIILTRIISKQLFFIKEGFLYVQNGSDSIKLFTDFKKLQIDHYIQEIKADAKYDSNTRDYVIENNFGELLLGSFYACFRMNSNFHITGYKIEKEWYREVNPVK